MGLHCRAPSTVIVVTGTFKYIYPKLRAKIIAGEKTWAHRHKRKNYIVAAILSAPPWLDRKELRTYYDLAKARTLSTGVCHVVDHIVPLGHPMVCGLTVPWNLQVITFAENAWKSNRFAPNQLELF